MDRWTDTKRGKDGEGRKARKKESVGWESGMEGRREGGWEDLFQDSSQIAYLIKPFQDKALPEITPQ